MKEKMFDEKLLLVIASDFQIFNQEYRISIIEYCDKKREIIKNRIKEVDPIKAELELKILKRVEFIPLRVSEFLDFLSDRNLLTMEECFRTNYKDIFQSQY